MTRSSKTSDWGPDSGPQSKSSRTRNTPTQPKVGRKRAVAVAGVAVAGVALVAGSVATFGGSDNTESRSDGSVSDALKSGLGSGTGIVKTDVGYGDSVLESGQELVPSAPATFSFEDAKPAGKAGEPGASVPDTVPDSKEVLGVSDSELGVRNGGGRVVVDAAKLVPAGTTYLNVLPASVKDSWSLVSRQGDPRSYVAPLAYTPGEGAAVVGYASMPLTPALVRDGQDGRKLSNVADVNIQVFSTPEQSFAASKEMLKAGGDSTLFNYLPVGRVLYTTPFWVDPDALIRGKRLDAADTYRSSIAAAKVTGVGTLWVDLQRYFASNLKGPSYVKPSVSAALTRYAEVAAGAQPGSYWIASAADTYRWVGKTVGVDAAKIDMARAQSLLPSPIPNGPLKPPNTDGAISGTVDPEFAPFTTVSAGLSSGRDGDTTVVTYNPSSLYSTTNTGLPSFGIQSYVARIKGDSIELTYTPASELSRAPVTVSR